MDNKQKPQNEIKIELTPEVAHGHYSNLAMIAHSPNEFVMVFINMIPNPPQARVQARVIMTPENAKNLFFALRENIERYENTFGVIEQRHPVNGANPTDNNVPNSFKA
jgi:hypothetical protein